MYLQCASLPERTKMSSDLYLFCHASLRWPLSSVRWFCLLLLLPQTLTYSPTCRCCTLPHMHDRCEHSPLYKRSLYTRERMYTFEYRPRVCKDVYLVCRDVCMYVCMYASWICNISYMRVCNWICLVNFSTYKRPVKSAKVQTAVGHWTNAVRCIYLSTLLIAKYHPAE